MLKRNEYLLVFLCEGRVESINLFGESFEKKWKVFSMIFTIAQVLTLIYYQLQKLRRTNK